MRVLWFIGIILPTVAEGLSLKNNHYGGGWLTGISNMLIENTDVEFGVCMPSTVDEKVKNGRINNVNYFFYPEKASSDYDKKTEQYMRQIIENFQPDIIHAFGTEHPRIYSLINVAERNKLVISITGLVSKCAIHYYGDIPIKYTRKKYLKRFISKFTPLTTISQARDEFMYRGKYEKQTLKNAVHVIGRTTWDYACIKEINPKIKYHFCNEILRDSFYKTFWAYEKCIPYTILVSQAGYPIKGLHKLLLQLPYIKKTYPSVKVMIAGNDMINRSSKIRQKALHISNEYSSYLYKLITELNLKENVIFTGPLSESQMINAYLKTNVFVLSSSVENSPNSLGEAMILGVPCIASCVGGVQDMFRHNIDGYLYPFDEPYMLAHYICNMFEKKENIKHFTMNARENAFKIFNKEKNIETLLNIYKSIYTGKDYN